MSNFKVKYFQSTGKRETKNMFRDYNPDYELKHVHTRVKDLGPGSFAIVEVPAPVASDITKSGGFYYVTVTRRGFESLAVKFAKLNKQLTYHGLI